MKKIIWILCLGVGLAQAEPWPGRTPVVGPQADGVIVLDAVAAGFLMRDRLGQHVMNDSDPKLVIKDGAITNLGEGAQYPAWRFRVDQPGKYAVYLLVDPSDAEDCAVRISFMENKREFRVVAPVPKGGPPVVRLGEASFTAGTFDAIFMLNAVSHNRRLPHVRGLRMLPVAESGSASIFDQPDVKAELAKNSGVRTATEAARQAAVEWDLARKQWNGKEDFSAFTSYDQMVAWDRNAEIVAKGAARMAELNEAVRMARLKALESDSSAFSPPARAALEKWREEQRKIGESLTRNYPATIFPKSEKPVEPTLFPVGGLDQMKNAPSAPNAKVYSFEPPARPDAAERKKAFESRNSPGGIAALGQQLQAALRPDIKGLEKFYEACAAGRYDRALEAYRDYFFLKLKSPEKVGAQGFSFVDDFFQQNGKAGIIRPPYPERVKKNMEGIAVYRENGREIEAKVGGPGSVDWAPASMVLPPGTTYVRAQDSSPFWKTAEGIKLGNQIQFYRALNRLPTMADSTALFPDLLFSYAFTGNKEHLERFAAYIDDWTMHSVQDIDNCPVNVRAATELQVIGWFRGVLRVILDERPEFARDFPAPTLARFMLNMTETFHPYVVRAKRAELANWGIMGVEAALQDSLNFHEFRSMDYMNRELTRLARINFIQHVALDGEGLEAWDEGHTAIDRLLEDTPALSRHGAPVMGDLEAQAFTDHVRTAQRSLMTHISPDGNYWVPWLSEDDSHRASIRGKIMERNLIDKVFDESEVRARFSAILGKTPPKQTPPLSDIQPYAALFYLRDRFGKEASSLLLQNFPVRSQTQALGFNSKRGHIVGCMRTGYGVAHDGKGVLEGSPILVDSKPPNYYVDLTPTGGKTDYSFQTPRRVQPGRFSESAEFDIAETFQDSPYRRYQFAFGKELFGVDSKTPDEPIRDVRAVRQVVHLRNEGIFIIGDRVESKGSHEFTQMFIVPQRVAAPGEIDRLRLLARMDAVLVEKDPVLKRVRSLGPGLPNVSLYVAGHDFTWGGRCTGENAYEAFESVTAASLYGRIKAAKLPDRELSENLIKTLSVRWEGEGNQALATVVLTRAARRGVSEAGEGELEEYREMNGAGGVSGFSFRTAKGAQVWFQMAPAGSMELKAGPGEAQGGSLLVVKREGVFTGVVMDGSAVVLEGKSYKGPAGGFEFRVEKDGKFSAVAVRAPIDTVVVSPQQTVFTEKVRVSFDIPGQKREDVEYRYTLDGSDPTLESMLYKGPFELVKDTLVKVRPYLKGLKKTPWNIAGVEGGKTVGAVFRKTGALPAVKAGGLEGGLGYEYFEDSWVRLVSHSGMYPYLPVKGAGKAAGLLDGAQLEKIRKTDRAFGVKYEGYIEVPAGGIYRFFAPEPLYNTTKDAGYELRIWIDGREWFPNPDLHAENIWSVALEKGLHRFQASYVDYRWKSFRNEYWMGWRPEQMWEGVPVLEVDGPDLPRQPLPNSWLKHKTTP